MDEVTGKEKIREALKKEFHLIGLQELPVKSLQGVYSGTQRK